MSESSKFMFDDKFDEIGSDRSPTAKQPAISAEDLARAREQAFAEGRSAGVAATRGEIDAAIAKALDAIMSGLTGLGAAQVTANDAMYRDGLELACLVAGRLAPALIADQPLAEVEALVRDCLGQLRDEPRIVVRVGEESIDDLAPRIDGLAERCGFPGKIVLLPEDGLAVGDCRVEWADGGAERNREFLASAVDTAVARYMEIHRTEGNKREPPVWSSVDDVSAAPSEPAGAQATGRDVRERVNDVR